VVVGSLRIGPTAQLSATRPAQLQCSAIWLGETQDLEPRYRGAATVPLRVERLAATPWDPPLAEVMRSEGVAVFEEALLEALVEDREDSLR
jgi:hypothetical protein